MILHIHFHILLEYITSDNYNYSQHGVKVFISHIRYPNDLAITFFRGFRMYYFR